MSDKKLTNIHFDISGNSILRLTRFYLLSRILPMGDNRGGPGWKCLVVLGLFHYFGKQFYWIERRMLHLKTLLRTIKRRLLKK